MTFEMDDDAAGFHKERRTHIGHPLIEGLSWAIWRMNNGHSFEGRYWPPDPEKPEKFIRAITNKEFLFT